MKFQTLIAAALKAPPPPANVGEPATFGLLGAGLALMGWTRRQGKGRQGPRYGVFPWPGLSWLD